MLLGAPLRNVTYPEDPGSPDDQGRWDPPSGEARRIRTASMAEAVSPKWVELSIEAPAEYVEPLSHLFRRYGKGGVVTEEPGGYSPDEGERPPAPDRVTVKTFYPLDQEAKERRGRIDVGVRLMSQIAPISPLTERVIEEREWEEAWKEHFHPLRAAERLVVVPTWREFTPDERDLVIRLDPGMAFGTGHHPTTRMCLEQVEACVKPGMSVLDVGCGSGILSIAAAVLGARLAFGLDVDEAAAAVAEANASENGAAGVVSIANGSLPHPRVRRESYDLALANISAKVVIELAGILASAVKPGGAVVVSGFLLKDEDGVRQACEETGGAVEDRQVDGEWVTLRIRIPTRG